MSYVNGTATDLGDLMDKLAAFLAIGHPLEPAYTGVGTGTINSLAGTPASVPETITVTFTSATAFSVVGSVSGALGTGTVGVAFTCTVCTFTIVAGGTAWAAADSITFWNTQPWQVKLGTARTEYIWRAPGNDGSQDIFVGVHRFTDVGADYDNLRLGGFIGYVPGTAWTLQPGACTRPVLPGIRVGTIPYWLTANGRRCTITVKNSTVYDSAYLGLLKQYPNPSQLPYPLVVGGSMAFVNEPGSTSPSWRWSYTGAEHQAYPMPNFNMGTNYDISPLRMRKPDGAWLGFQIYLTQAAFGADCGYTWPYTKNNAAQNLRPNLDGTFPLLPIVLNSDSGYAQGATVPTLANTWGELDGVLHVTGHSNSAENVITLGRTPHLVVQNVFYNTKMDYFAVQLA